MKAKLSQKYLPITFHDQQLDKWSRFTHETRSAAKYIEKFDVFLTRCSEFVDESPMVTLSRFRYGLCNDLRRELFTRGVSDLEHAYQIVRDLDASRRSYYQRGSDYKSQGARTTSGQSQLKPNFNSLAPTDLKGKGPVESVPRANPRTQCFKCQGYEHVEKFCASKSRTLFLDD